MQLSKSSVQFCANTNCVLPSLFHVCWHASAMESTPWLKGKSKIVEIQNVHQRAHLECRENFVHIHVSGATRALIWLCCSKGRCKASAEPANAPAAIHCKVSAEPERRLAIKGDEPVQCSRQPRRKELGLQRSTRAPRFVNQRRSDQ